MVLVRVLTASLVAIPSFATVDEARDCVPDGQCFTSAGFDTVFCCSGAPDWSNRRGCPTARCGPGLETSPHNNTDVNAVADNEIAHAEGLEGHGLGRDTSLFIGPFYELNSDVEQSHAAAQFRDAYCQARHIADTEDFTTIFNTGVGDGPIYFTREEFTDGESFNLHLNNVSSAFAHALGVARPTGFVATGTHRDLHTIRENAKHNHMTTFVKDRRCFKRQQFKGDDYFSLDFFMTLPHSDLDFFVGKWHELREFAATKSYMLGLCMAVRTYVEDGHITVHLQETYASVPDYLNWLPEAAQYADAFFSVGEIASAPNPLSMFGKADQLALARDHCNDLAEGRGLCVQYAFDRCLDGGDVVV